MPYGTAADDACSGTRCALRYTPCLEPFCALCDGAGMSYRTIRKHPHVHWERYQKAGLRISSDRDFNTTSLALRPRDPGGAPDRPGEFRARGRLRSRGLPRRRFQRHALARSCPDDPRLSHKRRCPSFDGDLTRDYLVAGYRTVYDRFKATPPTGFNEGIVRKWITLQLLAILDERNFTNALAGVVDAIEINLRIHQAPARRLVPQLQYLARARERIRHTVPNLLLVFES